MTCPFETGRLVVTSPDIFQIPLRGQLSPDLTVDSVFIFLNFHLTAGFQLSLSLGTSLGGSVGSSKELNAAGFSMNGGDNSDSSSVLQEVTTSDNSNAVPVNTINSFMIGLLK
ncbi:hypothetical protein [Kaistella palustris]|uniref:hypothetical protein n=1 Tax=Kaistella palustris TaxID=493376 RepID=UPI0004870AB4|nr:hypothetical protein [Kaistella palustris]